MDILLKCLMPSALAALTSKCCYLLPSQGFDPWVRKIPWGRECQPTLVFLSGESRGQRSLVGYSPWDRQELDTTEQLTHIRTPRKRSSAWGSDNAFKHLLYPLNTQEISSQSAPCAGKGGIHSVETVCSGLLKLSCALSPWRCHCKAHLDSAAFGQNLRAPPMLSPGMLEPCPSLDHTFCG